MTDPTTTDEDPALAVACPSCKAPAKTPCYGSMGTHADRPEAATLYAVERGSCALCRGFLVRGVRPPGTDVEVWHPNPEDAAVCPPMPDPKTDWESYAAAINRGAEPGKPGPDAFVPADAIEHVAQIDFNEVAYPPVYGRAAEVAASLVDAGYGTPDEVARGLADALTRPVTEPLATSGPRDVWCPECVAGKCPNCDGRALDPVTDQITDCTCPHEGTPRD